MTAMMARRRTLGAQRILGVLAAKCGGDRPVMRIVGGLTIALLAACSDVRTVELGEVAEARSPSGNTAGMPSAPGEVNDAGTTDQAAPDAGATSSGAAGASSALPPTAADAAVPSTNTRDAQLDDDEDDDSEESGQSDRGRDEEEDAGERSED